MIGRGDTDLKYGSMLGLRGEEIQQCKKDSHYISDDMTHCIILNYKLVNKSINEQFFNQKPDYSNSIPKSDGIDKGHARK